MWETFQQKTKGRHAVMTQCEYNPDSGYYKITMKRGEKQKSKRFKAKEVPKNGYMLISDVEKAVQLANILDKELRKK